MLKNIILIEKFKQKPKIPNIFLILLIKKRKKIARLFLSQFQAIRFSVNVRKWLPTRFVEPVRNNNLLVKFLLVVGHPELG